MHNDVVEKRKTNPTPPKKKKKSTAPLLLDKRNIISAWVLMSAQGGMSVLRFLPAQSDRTELHPSSTFNKMITWYIETNRILSNWFLIWTGPENQSDSFLGLPGHVFSTMWHYSIKECIELERHRPSGAPLDARHSTPSACWTCVRRKVRNKGWKWGREERARDSLLVEPTRERDARLRL